MGGHVLSSGRTAPLTELYCVLQRLEGIKDVRLEVMHSLEGLRNVVVGTGHVSARCVFCDLSTHGQNKRWRSLSVNRTALTRWLSRVAQQLRRSIAFFRTKVKVGVRDQWKTWLESKYKLQVRVVEVFPGMAACHPLTPCWPCYPACSCNHPATTLPRCTAAAMYCCPAGLFASLTLSGQHVHQRYVRHRVRRSTAPVPEAKGRAHSGAKTDFGVFGGAGVETNNTTRLSNRAGNARS